MGSEEHARSRGDGFARSWLPIAVFIALAAPFVDRPLDIDEPLYVDLGRWILAHPFDPLGGPSFWHDTKTTLFFDLYNPPLAGYFIAATAPLHAFSDVSLRITFMAVGMGCLLAARGLLKTLGVDPIWTLPVALSPAFAVTAVSISTDTLFSLLLLLALRGILDGGWVRAGLFSSLLAVTKYVGTPLLPLAIFAPLTLSRRVASLGLALLLPVGLASFTDARYGEVHLSAAGRFQNFAPSRVFECAAAFVASLAIAGAPAALLLVRSSRAVVLVSLALGTIVALATPARLLGEGNTFLAIAALAAGFVILVHALFATIARLSPLPASPRQRVPVDVIALFFLCAASVGAVYFFAVRYLVPIVPLLVATLALGGRFVAPSGRRFFGALAISAGLSVLALSADARHATFWRDAALALPADVAGAQTGRWGFSHYARGHGYEALDPHVSLRESPFTLIAVPRGIHAPAMPPAQEARLEAPIVARGVRPSPLSFRLMDQSAGAGWHSSAWGILPLSWSREPMGQVDLRPVRAQTGGPSIARPADQDGQSIVIDLGTPQGRGALLAGWSGDERDPSSGASFVWASDFVASVELPAVAPAHAVELRLFPSAAAEGQLVIECEKARAEVQVRAGWRVVRAAFSPVGDSSASCGRLTLRPAGHVKARWLDADRRARSIAVDWIRVESRP